MHLYDVVKKPHVTEKSQRQSVDNQYFFWVQSDATKPLVKAAVEKAFDVKVASVNMMVVKGKKKVFKGRMGQRSDQKKAMVRLMPGQTIDLGIGG